MADEQIVTNIVAKADFSDLLADLNRVQSALTKLQQTEANTNRALGKQIDVMNSQFRNTLRSTGQFSTQFVSVGSDVDKFGRNLDAGRIKLREFYRTWQSHHKTAGGLVRDLAKQQIQLQNAILQPLGKNAQGMMQFAVHVPKGMDLIKNRTKLANMELTIMNRLVQEGAQGLINWGKNTQWAGRQLTVGLTLPIVAFGRASQKAFAEADAQLTRLTKVYGDIAGASQESLARIRKDVSATAKELAQSYGAAYNETLALSADIAATGKEGKDLLGSIKETTRLAILGEVDRQEAMKATLAIQTAFKQNTEELTDSINFLNAVENQTSTTLNDLVEAIPKAGPVIKGLGGDVKDLALYITAMREGGISASEGANALKSGLASLINPTKVAVARFEEFGIDILGIVNRNTGNVTATLFELQSALDNLDPLQKQQAIEQLFGKFQFSRLNALFNNLGRQGSQTLQVLDLMKASAADLESVAARELTMVTESASGRYRRQLETLRANLAEVGDSFLSVSTSVLKAVNKIIEFVEKLPDPIKKALTFFGGLTALAGPLIMLTGVLGNFFGYIIKGVSYFRALFKGAAGWKLLTPEILAANRAGAAAADVMYTDAQAAEILKVAINDLIASYQKLSAAQTDTLENKVLTTVAGNPVLPATTLGRQVNPRHPLLTQAARDSEGNLIYPRSFGHMVPRGIEQPGTIFGVVPTDPKINLLTGKNPQIYMQEDLPRISGLTEIATKKGPVSTGIIASEAAKHHAMVATMAMQSMDELDDLKKSIATTRTATTGFMSTFDDILPITTDLTANAATQSAAIVAELRAGTITVEQARQKIIALNIELERKIAAAMSTYAATSGKTINLYNVPGTTQPVFDSTGRPNMKELFHKPGSRAFMEGLSRSLGVRTGGAGYNIETTIPKRFRNGVVSVGAPVQKYSKGVVGAGLVLARALAQRLGLVTSRSNQEAYKFKTVAGVFSKDIPGMTREGINKLLETNRMPVGPYVSSLLSAGNGIVRGGTDAFINTLVSQKIITARQADNLLSQISKNYISKISGKKFIGDSTNPYWTESNKVIGMAFKNNPDVRSLWKQFSAKSPVRTSVGEYRSSTYKGIVLDYNGKKIRVPQSFFRGSKDVMFLHATNPRNFEKNIGRYEDGVTKVPGGYGGGDIVPALLEPGESVLTKEATNMYAPLISAMNNKELPPVRMKYGGFVEKYQNGVTGIRKYQDGVTRLPGGYTTTDLRYLLSRLPGLGFLMGGAQSQNRGPLMSVERVPYQGGGGVRGNAFVPQMSPAFTPLTSTLRLTSPFLKLNDAIDSAKNAFAKAANGIKSSANSLISSFTAMRDSASKTAASTYVPGMLRGGDYLYGPKPAGLGPKSSFQTFMESHREKQGLQPPSAFNVGARYGAGLGILPAMFAPIGGKYSGFGDYAGQQKVLGEVDGKQITSQKLAGRLGFRKTQYSYGGQTITTAQARELGVDTRRFTPGMGTMMAGQMAGMGLMSQGQTGLGMGVMAGSMFAPQIVSGVGKMATGLASAVKSGGGLFGILSKLAFAGPIAAIAVGVAGIATAFVLWRKSVERTRKEQDLMFGTSKKNAEELGIKYKNINAELKAAQAATDLMRQTGLKSFNALNNVGGGFVVTSKEMKKEISAMKKSAPDVIKTINELNKTWMGDGKGKVDFGDAYSKSFNQLVAIAKNLKTQYLASGLSVDEATKKVYALIAATDRSGEAFKVISDSGFVAIEDAATGAAEAAKSYAKQVQLGFAGGEQQGNALQNVLGLLSAGTAEVEKQNRLEEEKARKAEKNQDFVYETTASYKALEDILDGISEKTDKNATLTESQLESIKKTHPELYLMLNNSDTLTSSYAKMRLELSGIAVDLKNMAPQAAEALAKYDAQLTDIVESLDVFAKTNKLLFSLKQSYDANTKGVQKFAKAEKDAYEEAIKRIDNRIKKINEEADARKKAIEAEFAAADAANRRAQLELEYNNAVASGNADAAEAARLQLEAFTNEEQKVKALAAIEDKRAKDEKKAQEERDAATKRNTESQNKLAAAQQKAADIQQRIMQVQSIQDQYQAIVKKQAMNDMLLQTGQLTQGQYDKESKAVAGNLENLSKVTADFINKAPKDFASQIKDALKVFGLFDINEKTGKASSIEIARSVTSLEGVTSSGVQTQTKNIIDKNSPAMKALAANVKQTGNLAQAITGPQGTTLFDVVQAILNPKSANFKTKYTSGTGQNYTEKEEEVKGILGAGTKSNPYKIETGTVLIDKATGTKSVVESTKDGIIGATTRMNIISQYGLQENDIFQVGKFKYRVTEKGEGYLQKYHNWNGPIPGPYNQEINATLKAGTEGVYQENYIRSLRQNVKQGSGSINVGSVTMNFAEAPKNGRALYEEFKAVMREQNLKTGGTIRA